MWEEAYCKWGDQVELVHGKACMARGALFGVAQLEDEVVIVHGAWQACWGRCRKLFVLS